MPTITPSGSNSRRNAKENPYIAGELSPQYNSALQFGVLPLKLAALLVYAGEQGLHLYVGIVIERVGQIDALQRAHDPAGHGAGEQK